MNKTTIICGVLGAVCLVTGVVKALSETKALPVAVMAQQLSPFVDELCGTWKTADGSMKRICVGDHKSNAPCQHDDYSKGECL